jgi:hypothetical protein
MMTTKTGCLTTPQLELPRPSYAGQELKINNFTTRSLAINTLQGGIKWAPAFDPCLFFYSRAAENGIRQHRLKQRLIQRERTAIADPFTILPILSASDRARLAAWQSRAALIDNFMQRIGTAFTQFLERFRYATAGSSMFFSLLRPMSRRPRERRLRPCSRSSRSRFRRHALRR